MSIPRLVILVLLITGAVTESRADDSRSLATGSRLQDLLQQRRGMSARGLNIREAFRQLQASTQAGIVLDRRVDPTTDVELETDFVTVRRTAILLADQADAQVSFADRFLYIAPAEAAARFRTLVQMTTEQIRDLRRELPAEVYAALLKSQPASWPRLTTPRDLLQEVCQQHGVTLQNAEQIPHDLWHRAELPSLDFAERASLILNQFDLSFRVEPDAQVVIVPLPPDIGVDRRHRLPAKERDELMVRISESMPELQIPWKRGAAVVRATVEQHERLERLISGESLKADPDAGLANKRFTVTLPAGTQIGQVLVTLQRQKIPVRFEGLSGVQQQQLLEREVSLQADRMPAAEFLEKVFAGADVTVDVQQEEVVIRPFEKSSNSDQR